MATILKIFIELLLNQKANWLETGLIIRWAIHLGPLVVVLQMGLLHIITEDAETCYDDDVCSQNIDDVVMA